MPTVERVGLPMTVALKGTRKVAVLSWDVNVVKGAQATIEAADEEKRTVKNDGESNLFFPTNFSGSVKVTVRGSHSGEESGEIQVP